MKTYYKVLYANREYFGVKCCGVFDSRREASNCLAELSKNSPWIDCFVIVKTNTKENNFDEQNRFSAKNPYISFEIKNKKHLYGVICASKHRDYEIIEFKEGVEK